MPGCLCGYTKLIRHSVYVVVRINEPYNQRHSKDGKFPSVVAIKYIAQRIMFNSFEWNRIKKRSGIKIPYQWLLSLKTNET